jgi:hypothetical protein
MHQISHLYWRVVYTLRQKESLAILDLFKIWLDNPLTTTSPQSKIYEAIRYSLANWDFLNNYLNDGRIEITIYWRMPFVHLQLAEKIGYSMAAPEGQKLAQYFTR